MTTAELLARQVDDARAWTLNLIDDFADADWTFQPDTGLAHALWLCGHLTGAQNTLIHVRCLGQSVLDESFTNHFPIGGPVKSTDEHDFPPVDAVLKTMHETHAKTCDAIRGMGEPLLIEPAFGKDGRPHPHFKDKLGAVSHCARHEAFHAGQLAMLRRLLGKSFLR